MNEQNKCFKILSIDGGGILGLYSLYVLNVIEQKYCIPKNKVLSNYFDMICGTSSGSIIALCIANRMPINEIINEYKTNATKLFPSYKFPFSMMHNLKFLMGCKYSQMPMYEIGHKIFNTKTLNELNNLVCIPSFSINTYQNTVFKFPHKEGQIFIESNIKIVDALMASSSTPLYFPCHHIDYSHRKGFYIDSGIWANNPSMVGILEALRYFVGKNKQYDKYSVLSIGNIKYNDRTKPTNNYF